MCNVKRFIVQEDSYLASSSFVLRKFNIGTKASGSLSINICFGKEIIIKLNSDFNIYDSENFDLAY